MWNNFVCVCVCVYVCMLMTILSLSEFGSRFTPDRGEIVTHCLFSHHFAGDVHL